MSDPNDLEDILARLSRWQQPKPTFRPPSLSDWIDRPLEKPNPQFAQVRPTLPIKVTPKPKPTVSFAPPAQLRRVGIRRPKVFVSFDYENDAHYQRLLGAWHANKQFEFSFQDETPGEIKTERVDRVKAVLSTKVQDATHVLVLIGRYANQLHPDAAEIGFRNWINYEIDRAKFYNKKLVGVVLPGATVLPDELKTAQGLLVPRFDETLIVQALKEVK